jgi:hypothetical protein
MAIRIENPVPVRFRRSLGNVVLTVLVFLALTGLHAIISGSEPSPPPCVLIGFGLGSILGVLVRGAMAGKAI